MHVYTDLKKAKSDLVLFSGMYMYENQTTFLIYDRELEGYTIVKDPLNRDIKAIAFNGEVFE